MLSHYDQNNPFGHSITAADIRQDFRYLEDWEDRYRFIIELGSQLPHLPESLRTPQNRIHGCQSQVWIAQHLVGERYQFALDSDAHIVRGLIAIVLSALNNKTAEYIGNTAIEDLFTDLGLLQHLSPLRGNGLRAMVERIRSLIEPGKL